MLKEIITTMKGLKLLIKSFLLICIASKLMAQHSYEKWDTSSEELIYKEIATHKIVNEELINLIVEYDDMYAPFIFDSTRGITVFCRISKKTITYSVCYTVGIGGRSPILLCEPINGREVHINLLELYKQIQLPYMCSVELLKKSHPKQYENFKIRQKEAEKEGATAMTDVTSSFVWWEIIFDKHTGKCLKKNTPDRTKQYQKQYDEYRRLMNSF